VSDKAGLLPFARALAERGVALVSTGGTRRALAEAGLSVEDVSDLTGFPELMDGRVKTLHPAVHGGLLGVRANPEHQAAMLAHGIAPIDLLVVNLYPFEAAVVAGAAFEACVEEIDIGGPAMIRAAAKNHRDVAVVVDPGDYGTVLADLDAHGGAVTATLRRRLAQKAFARTASYDAAISNWLADAVEETTPAFRALGGILAEPLRYGENPHQTAAFYRTPERRPGVATARQVQGKELSYNNIADIDAAYECVAEFDPARTAAVAIVKHANPCGVAEGETLLDAYERALACDPVSAFGGIVAFNRPLDGHAARRVVEIFTEAIVAPDATEEARRNRRHPQGPAPAPRRRPPDPRRPGLQLRTVAGGFLAQGRDDRRGRRHGPAGSSPGAPRPSGSSRTSASPSGSPSTSSRTRSSTPRTAGPSASAPARCRGWLPPASPPGRRTEPRRRPGSPRASPRARSWPPTPSSPSPTAFSPRRKRARRAAIQPGGSVRDEEVIRAADEAGLAMVFTGRSALPALRTGARSAAGHC
jgi:phosphoribosylaminoimidazolecarboxamide formyltransferase/IMP cyclohydrolase